MTSKLRWTKNTGYVVFIVVVTIILILISIIRYSASSPKTILPQPIVYKDSYQCKGIVIRNEIIYSKDKEGEIYPLFKDGEKVAYGSPLANYLVLKDTTSIKRELTLLESKISVLEGKSIDADSLGVNSNLISIREQIKDGNVDFVNNLKTILLISLGAQTNEFNESIISEEPLTDLIARRDQLLATIEQFSSKIYAKNSGYVYYELDGFEDTYNLDSFNELTELDFEQIENKTETSDINYSGLKVVDDYIWYIALLIDNELLDELDELSYVTANLLLEDGSNIRLESPIYDRINLDNQKSIIKLKSNDFITKVMGERFYKAEIINNEYRAFSIPKSTIVNINGADYVYIKTSYGVARIRRVKILEDKGALVIIKRGNSDGRISIDDEDNIRTISLYDEVLLNAKNYKDGQILK